MKNKTILIFGLLLIASITRAQYVLIPDSNFRHALISQGYAPCFDLTLTMLDTTCSGVLDSTILDVSTDSTIVNMEGVQYFKHLLKLDCDFNQIDTLPALPRTLSILSCWFNKLRTLPPLPDSLTELECVGNYISSIPLLPNTLTDFNCAGNSIYGLPHLPASLVTLICAENYLDSLPAILPPSLITLNCAENHINFLPTILPVSLEILNCESNLLSVLPVLPHTIQSLNCGSNYLSVLPALYGNMTDLICYDNQLTYIPNLPHRISSFNCSGNPQLMCLPQLDTISDFNFENTAITCLPNAPAGNPIISPANVPICNAPCAYINGINDLSNNVSLNIYPNPATDVLHCDFDFGNYSVSLFDMMGGSLPLLISDDGINVSALPVGIYGLHIQNNESSIVKKFIKQ
jgi:hypothetical protein